MKKLMVLTVVALLLGFNTMAQKVQVLYFKANLSCCAAKACATLEKDVKTVVEKNFSTDKVTFSVVKLEDEVNKKLVEKYNAKSQTVVLVVKKKKKEKIVDLSDVVRKYSRGGNKDEFEKEFVTAVNGALK